MSLITGLQDVFYFVSDMDRAVAFYRDVIELGEPAFASAHWTSFAVSGLSFALHWSEGEPVQTAKGPHGSLAGATVTFGVDDLKTAVATLRARGVPILEERYDPWGSLATFTDPDGNVLKLMQPS
jgi:predicted enzyme related to lactoylglutathione lyase